MHFDPPPSSALSLQRRRDDGPIMESNQDPRIQILLFIPRFYPLTLFLPFFHSFVQKLFALVEYTVQLSRPEVHGGPGRAGAPDKGSARLL